METSEIIRKQITILRAICEEIKAPDETTRECAMEIYAEVNKDLRMAEIHKERNNNHSNNYATDKQLKFMMDLKIPIPDKCTKEEAKKLIKAKVD